MLLLILAFIIPSVFAYDRDDCNCETLLDYTSGENEKCHWTNQMNPQTGTNGRVVCDSGLVVDSALDLTNADLRGAHMPNIWFSPDMTLRSGFSWGININNAIFDGAYLEGAVFEWQRFVQGVLLQNEPSFFNVDGRYRINGVIHGSSTTQADVDAAYADGAASVTPEDGIGQSDVDAAVAALKASETGLVAAYKELKNC